MAWDKNGRPNHIEAALCSMHENQWFMWTDNKNKIYANLRLTEKFWDSTKSEETPHEEGMMNNPYTLPSEQECTDGLAQMQTDFDNAKTKQETDKTNANQKLKDLGLTDDEIKAIKGIS
jgi:hypothetical protein